MRTPRIACALITCFLALTTLAKEDATPGETLWEVETDGRVMATAAMDRTHVYFGTASASATAPESTLYCLKREDGQERWSRSFPNWLLACPVVSHSRLYVGCDDTKLYCLDKSTGDTRWVFDTAGRIDSTPCVDTPGNCYFGSRDRFLYALNPKGELLWSHFLKGPIASSPTLHEGEGRLYVADLANTIYAFSLDGELLWSYKPRLPNIDGIRLRIYSSPALDNEQFLYVGSGDHHLYAVDRATGFLFWKANTEAIVDSSPVISGDEFLYVANRDGVLFKYLIEPLSHQREMWRNENIGQVFYSSPTVDQANNLYICGAPTLAPPDEQDPMTQLSYINRVNGDIVWFRSLPGYTDAAPALDESGDLYLGTAAGSFYKLRGAGLPLADTSWPTFHGHGTAHGRFEKTYTQWLIEFMIPPELASPARDTDEDGYLDFEEFVWGTDPRDPLDQPKEAKSLKTKRAGQFSFTLQKGIRSPFEFQQSLDLETWSPVPFDVSRFQFSDLGNYWQVVGALGQTETEAYYRLWWPYIPIPEEEE